MMAALGFSDYECAFDLTGGKKYTASNCHMRAYYAASILFEVYTDADGKNPEVQLKFDNILFNNICNLGDGITSCPLETFRNYVIGYTYKTYSETDPSKNELWKTYLCKNGPDN